MEERTQETTVSRRGSTVDRGIPTTEPVRTRWTPKPEQILILESIFNSGSSCRIFGPVGDANVFYWFQNRRSRSRRRQRQMQATLAGTTRTGGGATGHQASSSTATSSSASSTSVFCVGLFLRLTLPPPLPSQQAVLPPLSPEAGKTSSSRSLGFMTVFINGIPQEVPRGPIDMGAVFGHDVMLVHSSGELVPTTDLGILFQGLHAGESYFLLIVELS
ncbi:unnamed protein product [Spirodela intermedia]|uniref:Homeobox domain-containing protein n=1 Tax=Spirodela intermedia TaxID=51605 RepID=A0A7I8JGC9_SPIIN|nr:unnamed protein product [Spirodela intermedia]CAA6669199.1 unnamed protein product [Spirodela intermedia]